MTIVEVLIQQEKAAQGPIPSAKSLALILAGGKVVSVQILEEESSL